MRLTVAVFFQVTQLKIDNNPFAKAFRLPASENKGHGGAGPPYYPYSMTSKSRHIKVLSSDCFILAAPSYPVATSHPWMLFPPDATDYMLYPPYSGQCSNYSQFPYHYPSLIPQSPLASSSVSTTCSPLAPFQFMQQWRSMPPSRVGAATVAAAATVSNPQSSGSSRTSPGRHQGQRSFSHTTTTASSSEEVRIRQPQQDPENTGESDEQLPGEREES